MISLLVQARFWVIIGTPCSGGDRGCLVANRQASRTLEVGMGPDMA